MLHTSEQFANRQFKERHVNVAQGVTSRQTERRDRHAAAAATMMTSTCVKPARLVNTTEKEIWMITRQEARRQRLKSRTMRCMIEVQSDVMQDRNSEREERTHNG